MLVIHTFGGAWDCLDVSPFCCKLLAYVRLAGIEHERTSYAIAHSRWIDDANWEQHTKPTLFGRMKQPTRTILPRMLRRQVAKTMYGQGIGRHSPAEIYAFGVADLEALAHLLGDSPFFFGDTPRELDTHAHAFLMSMVATPCESPMRDFIGSHDTLMPYYQRMDALIHPAGA